MTEMAITSDRDAQNRVATGSNQFVSVRDGLALYISRSGQIRRWVYRHTNGLQVYGQLPEMGYAQAVAAHQHFKYRNLPLIKLVDKWKEQYLKNRTKNADSMDARVNRLKRHLHRFFPNVRIEELHRFEVHEACLALQNDGHHQESALFFKELKQLLSWGTSVGYLDRSPLEGVIAAHLGLPNYMPRQRWLTDAEIWVFWKSLDMLRLDKITKLKLKLCLLTGQRREEVTMMRWSNVDLKKGLWLNDDNKSNRAFLVPLAPMALQLLKEAKKLGGNRTWVFPSSGSNKPQALETMSKGVERNLDKIGLEKFTPHDLRRTVKTHLAMLKVPRDHRDMLLNHSMGDGMDTVYNLYDYFDEKKEALEKWEEKLTRLFKSSSPVSLEHKVTGSLVWRGVSRKLPKS